MFGMGGRTYGELTALRREVGQMAGQMAAWSSFMGQATRSDTDHENRLRALERWRYALPLSALASLTAVILAALHLIAGH